MAVVVFLWLRCNTLCTSGVMDDVICSYSGPMAACRYHSRGVKREEACYTPVTALLLMDISYAVKGLYI